MSRANPSPTSLEGVACLSLSHSLWMWHPSLMDSLTPSSPNWSCSMQSRAAIALMCNASWHAAHKLMCNPLLLHCFAAAALRRMPKNVQATAFSRCFSSVNFAHMLRAASWMDRGEQRGECCNTLTACRHLQLGVAFSIGQVRVKATQKRKGKKM